MFTIEKAVLTANGDFNEQSLKEAKLDGKIAKLASKKNGITFHDADGSLFCYARFSKGVKERLVNGELTLEQVLAFCRISSSEYEGQTYYSLTIPESMRGGLTIGKVADVAKTAKPLKKATTSLADISKMIEI